MNREGRIRPQGAFLQGVRRNEAGMEDMATAGRIRPAYA
jgi:hypothetical protein